MAKIVIYQMFIGVKTLMLNIWLAQGVFGIEHLHMNSFIHSNNSRHNVACRSCKVTQLHRS